jgi:mono/diheme cytochrome c family protein
LIQSAGRPLRAAPLALLVALLTTAVSTPVVEGQTTGAAPPPTTTKGRVYSLAQASRGELTYMTKCVSCHPPGTYKAAVFLNWQGRSLAELLAFLMEKMPKSDPGSLAPKEYAQVIAYLLKINGNPAGRADIPADTAALRGITINILPDKLTATQ